MIDETKNGTLPAVYEMPRPAAPVRTTTYTVLPDEQPDQAPIPLAHYLWLLKRHRWRLLFFVAICVAATLIVSLRLVPVYEATATVDIDRQSAPGVVGQEATRAALNDSDQFMATQIRLIQSDSVLRPIAQKYHLRDMEGSLPTDAPRADAEDAPVVLKKLKVTRPADTYLLLISYRSTNRKLAAEVANGITRSYIEHTFDLRYKASASLSEFMEKQIEALRAKMEGSTAALTQFERELNVINPEDKTSILSARLLQLNTEYTNAQADRVRKEAAAQSMDAGTLESAESSEQGDSLRRLSEHLTEVQEKFAQIKAQYGTSHQEYRKMATQVAEIQADLEKTRANIAGRVTSQYREALNRERMLRTTVDETKSEFDRLNARSFQYQQLKREAESNKKLYEELATRIKEASINATFQNSTIRLADAARAPVKPVFPNVPLNALIALILATLLGLTSAVLADLLDNTVRDPDEIAKSLNTTVIGTLPSVKSWRGSLSPIAVAGSSHPLTRLDDAPATGFAESVRTLRNAILLADFDRRLKTILVTSASPSEGKSTTASYLALSHAQQGRKTLLIDGDLRRPSIHRRFNLSPTAGLSNVFLGEVTWRDVALPVAGTEMLDILPAGTSLHRSVDLMGTEIAGLLSEVSREYDLVILDAPPVLGFAELLEMSIAVDGVLIVARAGETNRRALASVYSSLNRLRATVLGLVLNEIDKDTHDGYYYYGYYSKSAAHYNRKQPA